MQNLTDYLVLQKQLRPNRIAVSDENSSLSFSELHTAALNISQQISRLCSGITGQPVIVFAEKGVLCYTMLMGVLFSGNCYAPLDIKMPPERLRRIISQLGARAAVTTSVLAEKLTAAGFSGELIICDSPLLSPAEGEPVRVSASSPAYILFTSGSTGEPKGVVLSHKAVIHHMEWQAEHLPMSEDAVLGNQAPFYFDASMPDIFTPLFCGVRLHIIPEKLFLLPNRLIQHINQSGVNTLIWVPSALTLLSMNHCFRSEIIRQLRTVIFCGEVMPTPQLNRWREVYPDTAFVNMYGPTEAAYGCTYCVTDREFLDSEPIPLGYPCEGTEILLCDGELCIIGERLAEGYYGNQALTAEKFTLSPDGRRMYRTGDLARYNSRGELEYIGRIDRQIKHSGYRIELGELESAAYSCDGIAACHALYAKETDSLVLFCIANGAASQAEIYAALKMLLPRYMLPAKIVFLDSFPLNANGKTDEKQLAAML